VGFEKIGKKNDRNTGVKIGNTDKMVGLADKSAGFGNFWSVFVET
jgi:hypothetical protein